MTRTPLSKSTTGKTVVDNVGRLAVVTFGQVVDVDAARTEDAHRFGADDVAHQVEEVAALFDHGAAGIAVEAVPVADLYQERKAVFVDGQAFQRADATVMNIVDETAHRRHEAVFHARPEDAGGARIGAVDDAARIFEARRQRLFA